MRRSLLGPWVLFQECLVTDETVPTGTLGSVFRSAWLLMRRSLLGPWVLFQECLVTDETVSLGEWRQYIFLGRILSGLYVKWMIKKVSARSSRDTLRTHKRIFFLTARPDRFKLRLHLHVMRMRVRKNRFNVYLMFLKNCNII